MTAALPGAERIAQGLRDLAVGRVTVESLLVSIAAPRLRALGMDVRAPFADAELGLYRLLTEQHGSGAHSRYNSLIRRVVSYQRAAACAN
jgi:hypothetical protein